MSGTLSSRAAELFALDFLDVGFGLSGVVLPEPSEMMTELGRKRDAIMTLWDRNDVEDDMGNGARKTGMVVVSYRE